MAEPRPDKPPPVTRDCFSEALRSLALIQKLVLWRYSYRLQFDCVRHQQSPFPYLNLPESGALVRPVIFR